MRSTPLSDAIMFLLIEAGVTYDGAALDGAERSITARLRFDHDGQLVTPLRDLVDDEIRTNPKLIRNINL